MLKRLPQATPREVIAALQRAGFAIHHTSGHGEDTSLDNQN